MSRFDVIFVTEVPILHQMIISVSGTEQISEDSVKNRLSKRGKIYSLITNVIITIKVIERISDRDLPCPY